jgi:hypothetical protein
MATKRIASMRPPTRTCGSCSKVSARYGLNRVFSAVKRKARGFRSIENLITMLYFTVGKLDLPVTH